MHANYIIFILRWLVDVTERAPTTALKTQNVLIQNQENQINVNSLTETGPRNLRRRFRVLISKT